jgi:hypothetical protein
MDFADFQGLLEKIQGATFASLDAVTRPSSGLVKTTLSASILLFSGKTEESGYEGMVKRRLLTAGKDPDSFSVGDLPWGEHVPGTPLIMSQSGRLYLQTVLLRPGEVGWTYLGKAIRREDITWIPRDEDDGGNQWLDRDKRVHVRTYALDSITGIRLLGERLPRKKLGLKLP